MAELVEQDTGSAAFPLKCCIQEDKMYSVMEESHSEEPLVYVLLCKVDGLLLNMGYHPNVDYQWFCSAPQPGVVPTYRGSRHTLRQHGGQCNWKRIPGRGLKNT